MYLRIRASPTIIKCPIIVCYIKKSQVNLDNAEREAVNCSVCMNVCFDVSVFVNGIQIFLHPRSIGVVEHDLKSIVIKKNKTNKQCI